MPNAKRRLTMKTIVTICLIFFSSFLFGQTGEWTWMHGDTIPNPTPSYGTQGLSVSSNNPPGRYEAAEWTDLQGNFWMFGGNGFSGRYNDLWKFNPATNQWTWMKGSNIIDQGGIYGTQGLSASTNNPGARGFGVGTWVDNSGNLWLFGGNGFDGSGGNGELNDLWKYNILSNEWTWMKGSSVVNQPGLYGIKLISSSLNNPKSRHETSATWTDNSDNLWLFGGQSIGPPYNDLWKYNTTTNQWTWMHGDSIASQPGIYGTIGISNPLNKPGARWSFAKWQTQSSDFYFFGGNGYDASGTFGRLNDLWKFNPATNEWTWINGANSANPIGSTDSMCVSATSNFPSGRMENRATWKDTCNNFIMFGGYNASGYYNDLWSYNILLNKWTWIGGDTLPNQPGVYGSVLISSSLNKPCGRWGSVGWKDLSGNFWMFGGNRNSSFYYNDLWKFQPDPQCMTCLTVGFNEIEKEIENKIYPNPTNQNATLQFDNSKRENCTLMLYDIQGRVVITIANIITDKVEIKRNNLTQGLYFFQLHTDREIITTGKLIIE